ncbi:MAG: Smr/MutS family protein [Casimicrobiaceae bacterium]
MAKLSELKTLLAATLKRKPATARSPTVAVIKAKEPVAPDVNLQQAFADVTRLAPANRAQHARPKPPSIPTQRLADDRAALAASKYGDEPSPTAWDIGQELEVQQTFLRTGLGTDVLTKLRRGHWVVQGELDLHGHTTIEAHDALADFLADARTRGWRCVRVIHGKGLSSPNREPVLKSKSRRWLAQRDEVLAYCEAQANAGGSGAVVVLLKANAAR